MSHLAQETKMKPDTQSLMFPNSIIDFPLANIKEVKTCHFTSEDDTWVATH